MTVTIDRVRAVEAERQSLAAILSLLRNGQAATRLDLERASRLGRAIVSNRLATLIELGLVDEGGVGRSVGGRAPRLLRFNADAGRILVATLDRDTIGVGLADLDGQLMAEHYEDLDRSTTAERLFLRLEALCDWLLGQSGRHPPWALSLGVPGPVVLSGEDFDIPRLPATPDWEATHLVEQLVSRFGAPACVRSAVQMETVGEVGTLTVEQSRNLLFLDLGTEISAGIMSEGRLHGGAQGNVGQVGHIYAGERYTERCNCGNIGCLRTVAGCDSLVREGLSAASRGDSPTLARVLQSAGVLTVADVGTAARMGDAFSADLLARAGRLIGTCVSALVNALNPSVVVVGGELAQTGDICMAAIREGLYAHVHPALTSSLGILRSRMSRSAGLVGAARLAVETLFRSGFLETWVTFGTPHRHPRIAQALRAAEAVLRDRHGPSPPPDPENPATPA